MYPRRCTNCGNGFIAKYKTRKYCDKCHGRNTHTNRTLRRDRHEIDFIGIDGEGVNRPDGTHEYILLSVGNRSLHHHDGSRLTFYDIIPFLWECFLDKPTSVFVGFYLGYDFTSWLRDLPQNRAYMLFSTEGINLRKRTRSGENHAPFPVEHRGWNFDILGMKRFRLWRKGSDRRMYICDVGSFFQTSFLNAIDPAKWPDGPIVTEQEFKQIGIGKEDRGRETIPYGTPVDQEMLSYNILENEILGRLMTRYNEGLTGVGIRLKKDQWFGPGQAAQAWIKNINAPTRKEFEDATDIEIRKAMRYSYYGGWFEIFAHGHIPGTSWSYDINSAYPDIQSGLPCCLHGKWIKGNADGTELSHIPAHRWMVAHTHIRGNDRFLGGMPHRLRTGHILRPQETRGWYWTTELQASKQAGLIDDALVYEWFSYIPCDCLAPFMDERTLYLDRLRVGKNTMAGKARRLVYNSAYGKTAQSIGVAKYANPFYASAITSGCRTRILEAIASHPLGANDVLMVATDGVVFRNRHTNLNPISDTTLGAWSESRNENLTLFMPGVYWDDTTREKLRNQDAPSLKSRGIPARALFNNILLVDELFHNPFEGRGFPQISLPLTFSMVSPKQALAWNRWEDCGKVSHDKLESEIDRPVRHINSDPIMKRNPTVFMEDGIIRSLCYKTAFGETHSHPYTKTFGDEAQKELEEHLTPDGTIEMLLPEALR